MRSSTSPNTISKRRCLGRFYRARDVPQAPRITNLPLLLVFHEYPIKSPSVERRVLFWITIRCVRWSKFFVRFLSYFESRRTKTSNSIGKATLFLRSFLFLISVIGTDVPSLKGIGRIVTKLLLFYERTVVSISRKRKSPFGKENRSLGGRRPRCNQVIPRLRPMQHCHHRWYTCPIYFLPSRYQI